MPNAHLWGVTRAALFRSRFMACAYQTLCIYVHYSFRGFWFPALCRAWRLCWNNDLRGGGPARRKFWTTALSHDEFQMKPKRPWVNYDVQIRPITQSRRINSWMPASLSALTRFFISICCSMSAHQAKQYNNAHDWDLPEVSGTGRAALLLWSKWFIYSARWPLLFCRHQTRSLSFQSSFFSFLLSRAFKSPFEFPQAPLRKHWVIGLMEYKKGV